jgi:predicted metalloprotease
MEAGAGWRSRAATALGVAAVLGGLAGLALGLAPGAEPPPPLSAQEADLAARRSELVFDGAEAVFAARFAAELGRAYAPVRLRHFVRATSTACAGARAASGPFFCDETEEAAVDLAVIDALEPRLRREAGAGIALVSARIAAGHAALGLGPGADADCLTGVFAQDASARLGAVTATLYGRALGAMASALEATSPRAEWRDGRVFGGAMAAREAAFAKGLSGGRISACE